VNTFAGTVLPFPCSSKSAGRRALRKDLLRSLRVSGSPVIVNFSDCGTLNHEDIDLLLECMAQVAGRDTQMLFVTGSRANQVLLNVTRVSSLVPVFNSVEEALAYPQTAATSDAEDIRPSQSQEPYFESPDFKNSGVRK
jgi:hypothetical protein